MSNVKFVIPFYVYRKEYPQRDWFMVDDLTLDAALMWTTSIQVWTRYHLHIQYREGKKRGDDLSPGWQYIREIPRSLSSLGRARSKTGNSIHVSHWFLLLLLLLLPTTPIPHVQIHLEPCEFSHRLRQRYTTIMWNKFPNPIFIAIVFSFLRAPVIAYCTSAFAFYERLFVGNDRCRRRITLLFAVFPYLQRTQAQPTDTIRYVAAAAHHFITTNAL